MLQITRESESTRALQAQRRKFPARPVSNVSNIIVTLADGTVEYLSGCRANIIRSYQKHEGSNNHIISLRRVRQPLHLLNP